MLVGVYSSDLWFAVDDNIYLFLGFLLSVSDD